MPSKPQQTQPDPSVDDAIRRASQADKLLNDPILTEAFEKLRETYTQAWLDSGYEDVERREKSFRMVHAVNALESQLVEIVNNGKLQSSRVRDTVK